jgi:hypothetical protein
MAITVMALAAVVMVITGAAAMSGNAEQRADGDQAARYASENMVRLLRQVGLGASAGIRVPETDATSIVINPVFGTDGTGLGGSDELWMIVPSPNAFGESCEDPGAATTVSTAAPSGTLTVGCTSSFTAGQMLVASDMTSAALLTNVALASDAISYDQSDESSYVDAVGGYKVGDWVFGANAYHYYLATNERGRPALYRSDAVIDTGAGIFKDSGTPLQIQDGIEDFQVAYGLDTTNAMDPAQYTFQDGLGAAFVSGLRSVRVSLVSITGKTIRDTQVKTSSGSDLIQLEQVENHTRPAGAVKDGLRRSLYQRRVELPNMATGVL